MSSRNDISKWMNMIDNTQTMIHKTRINDRNSPYFPGLFKPFPYRNETTTSSFLSHRVTIIDRPCGTGKTTELLRSFKSDQRYLVVVPLLSEVRRVIEDAVVCFVEPRAGDESDTKAEHLDVLLQQGLNVVTTHKLFTEIATADTLGLLDNYHIIIDEVLDVVQTVPGKTPLSFDEFYLNGGYAVEGDDGLVIPTEKWDQRYELVSDTLDSRLYRMAKAKTLYRVDKKFFLRALPASLFKAGRSLTVYTYMAEGSLMLAYLKKLGIAFHHERYADEEAFRASARKLIDLRSIPGLDRKEFSFTYTGQTQSMGKTLQEKVANALKNLRQRSLRGVDLDQVIITCAKPNWQKDGTHPKPTGFAKGSRMFGAHWLPNTTRGTNDYVHASVCIYLYDQHINPCIRRWLGMDEVANDQFALAELIQWVYRSRVRRGQPITLYMPSKRMRGLLLTWLRREAVTDSSVPQSLAA